MKKLFAFLTICAIALAGCKEVTPDTPDTPIKPKDPILKLLKEHVDVTEEGATIHVSYVVENPVEGVDVEVSMEADVDWISNIEAGNGVARFVVAPNSAKESRETILTFDYEGAASCKLTVFQSAVYTPDPETPIELTEETNNNIYRQGYEGLGVDRYYFGLSNGKIIQNSESTYMPMLKSDYLFWCAFYGSPSADPTNPTIPAGTYTLMGDVKENGALDSFYTYMVQNDGYDNAVINVPVSATVTVEGEAGNYTILFDYTFEDDSRITAIYKGDVTLKVGTPLTAPTPWMEEDYLDAEFMGAYVNLIGSSVYTKDADIIGVQLYDCELSEDGHQTGGILVKLELTSPKLTDIEPMIPDGTYTVSMNSEMFSTPVGDILNLGVDLGGYTMMGTTTRVMNEDGSYLYGAVLTGSVTVTSDNGTQTIDVDLTTGKGQRITGTYSGPITINNYVYQPPLSNDPYSTLDGDMDIVADGNWSFTADYYTSYFSNRSDVSFIRFRGYSIPNANDILNIPWEGFYGFRFDLIVENDGNITIPSGTYSPDVNCERKAMTYEIGTRESSEGSTYYNGSYAYLGYDFVGYIDTSKMAPAKDGTLTIEKCGDDLYDIQYTVFDDKGNKITFSHRANITISKQ